MSYRVFSLSFTFLAHHATAYLRLRRLPCKLHSANLVTSLLAGVYYRARAPLSCVVAPSGECYAQVWQLARALRAREAAAGDCAASCTMLPDAHRHPQLHLATWATTVYACWWLHKVGMMYRFFRGGDGANMMDKMFSYAVPFNPFSTPAFVTKPFTEGMRAQLGLSGVTPRTEDFIDEHFRHLCAALETHLAQQSSSSPTFLFGTAHPTFADVTLGAAFSAYILSEPVPAAIVADQHPHLRAYVERVMGVREEADVAASDAVFDTDVLPPTLAPFLALQLEVMPFLVAQCAAFTAYMASDAVRTMTRVALRAPWEGCSGYLLPDLTDVRALMIIDDTISIVHAQSRDLEIALLAASEVVEEAAAAVSQGGSCDAPTCTLVEGHTATSPATTCALRGAEAAALQVFDFSGGFVEMDATVADFYRALSSKGRRQKEQTPQPIAKGSASSDVVLAQQSVEVLLRQLGHLLRQMHCPQYTLATVARNWMGQVAVIPEFEAAKLRRAQATAHP